MEVPGRGQRAEKARKDRDPANKRSGATAAEDDRTGFSFVYCTRGSF